MGHDEYRLLSGMLLQTAQKLANPASKFPDAFPTGIFKPGVSFSPRFGDFRKTLTDLGKGQPFQPTEVNLL